MKMMGLTLLIPEKADIERDSVAEAWEREGGVVIRIGRFWDPPILNSAQIRVYGNDTFCLVLQQKLHLGLVTPDDELILTVPHTLTKRWLVKRLLADIPTLDYPVFVKPLTPKLFQARVYASAAEIATECRGLADDTAILVSEVVTFSAEARCFIQDGRVLDCAMYEGDGDTTAAANAARDIVAAINCPRAFVLDIGFIADRGWAVIEFNAAWGAGLNGCDPHSVMLAIASASGGEKKFEGT